MTLTSTSTVKTDTEGAISWLRKPLEETVQLSKWLFKQSEDLKGVELRNLRESCPVRTRHSAGVQPLNMAELEAAFICGYAHPNFRDLTDAGHSRLTADSPKWKNLFTNHKLTAVAATEPSGGVFHPKPSTTAKKVGDNKWVINGEKSWISRLEEAEAVVIFTKGDDHRVKAFAAPLPNPALNITNLSPSGLRGWSWSHLTINNLEVSDDDLIPNVFSEHFARYRIIVSAVVCGATARSFDIMVTSMRSGKLQAHSERFGQAEASIRAATAFMLGQAGTTPQAKFGKLVKAHIVQQCLQTIRELLSVGGATSYQTDHPVRKRLRDLEAFEYADGPTDALFRSAGNLHATSSKEV